MRNKLWTLVLLAMTSVAAFAQLPVVGSTIDAKTGFKVNGAAPNTHTLCGNGTVYIDSSTPCTATTLFYQTVDTNGTPEPQRAVLNFSSFFALTDTSSPARTTVDGAHAGINTSCANPASITVDVYGRTTACTPGVTQHLTIIGSKGSASCSPPGGSFQVCTDTITWNQAFPDTGYTASCSLQSPVVAGDAGSNALQVYPHAATSTTTLTVSVQNLTSDSTITANDIVCIGQEL